MAKKNAHISMLTHVDKEGKATMVDVSQKPLTQREAIARATVHMEKATFSLISDNKISKGNVFETARIAGIMAAKKTSELIPLCHPLPITFVSINFKTNRKAKCIHIEAKVQCAGQTGVEMEALTAASVAALTMYDMCKAVDRGMIVTDIKLMKKSGGKSGTWKRSSGS